MSKTGSKTPTGFAYVEALIAHVDKPAGVSRAKGERFELPAASAWDREAKGLVKVIHANDQGGRTVKGPAPENKAVGAAPENKSETPEPPPVDPSARPPIALEDLHELATAYGLTVADVVQEGMAEPEARTALTEAIAAAKAKAASKSHGRRK